MKLRSPHSRNPLPKLPLSIALSCFLAASAAAASYEWTFDSANLSTSLGNGTMTYADAQSVGLTSFGSTGGGVPDIGGQTAQYMHVPAFANLSNGYLLTLNDTGPNGGGSYVNQYTIIFDFLSPAPLDWTPFFNTEPANANDADFYLASDGTVGIGSIYSGPVIAANSWYRLAFVADFATSTMTYFVNGTQVASGTQGGSGLDGRWSLYSNADPGADLLLFNEGDLTGQYTHELYINSIAFVDRALSGPELSALGGPNAAGILVPEPSLLSFAILGLAGLGLLRPGRSAGNGNNADVPRT